MFGFLKRKDLVRKDIEEIKETIIGNENVPFIPKEKTEQIYEHNDILQRQFNVPVMDQKKQINIQKAFTVKDLKREFPFLTDQKYLHELKLKLSDALGYTELRINMYEDLKRFSEFLMTHDGITNIPEKNVEKAARKYAHIKKQKR